MATWEQDFGSCEWPRPRNSRSFKGWSCKSRNSGKKISRDKEKAWMKSLWELGGKNEGGMPARCPVRCVQTNKWYMYHHCYANTISTENHGKDPSNRFQPDDSLGPQTSIPWFCAQDILQSPKLWIQWLLFCDSGCDFRAPDGFVQGSKTPSVYRKDRHIPYLCCPCGYRALKIMTSVLDELNF